MTFNLTPGAMLRVLLYVIGVLLVGNIVSFALLLFTAYEVAGGLIPMFNFDREKNVPAFYSAVALLIGALLLFVVANCHRREGARWSAWFILGGLFAFLSIDEFMVLHERVMNPLRAAFDSEGISDWPWLVPYGIAVLLIGAFYVPFLLQLPGRTRTLFIVAGSIFLGGAVGMEIVGGRAADAYGLRGVAYALSTTMEELMEKVGIALFIYALLDYMARQFGPVNVLLRAGAPASSTVSGVQHANRVAVPAAVKIT